MDERDFELECNKIYLIYRLTIFYIINFSQIFRKPF